MQPLPIDPVLPEILASLARTPRLVLSAPPGAGKTTRVPRALLDARRAAGEDAGEIVVLEPRRLAARLAARRVAEELGERLGETVGYTVRFDDVSSAKTRIRFVTEGVLTRRLLSERRLRGVGAVVLDEFHERHLQGDLALALLRAQNPDLPIVVMSATLAALPVARYLDAPVVESAGRSYPVDIEHAPSADDRPLELRVASAVRQLITAAPAGHVLVFLPGAAEIRRAKDACAKLAQDHGLELLPLHGDLPPEEQDRVVAASARRKVILSTNVAESSVTIDGVAGVVDSGLARVLRHAPWSGLPQLAVEKISRASATQRAGRAGRTGPGRCVRLYTRADFDARPDHDTPEIGRVDLAETLLELKAAGVIDPPWLDAPPDDAVRAATTLLTRLGALDERGGVTALGREMAEFFVHPRQARLLIEAERRGVVDDACAVAALLAERDVRAGAGARFDGAAGRGGPGDRAGAATQRSDVLAMLDAFREAREARFSSGAMRAAGLDPGATLAVERARAQLARVVSRRGRPLVRANDEEDALLQCVLAGWPDRVARRLRPGGRALALGGGGSAELAETSLVRDAPWMVAAAAEAGPKGRVLVRAASEIAPEWLLDLFPEAIVESREVRFDRASERVTAADRVLYDGLLLAETTLTPAPEEAARALAAAAREAGPRAFAPKEALDAWLARARFAATAGPVPAPDDAAVDAALGAMCEGRRSFAELREASLLDVLRARVGHSAAQAIERLAPERVQLASGRSAAVHYEPGKPPWIETYLQDFFGMAQTPSVGGGRVPLVVHLWAPNQRAVQVTSDLAGFWAKHYPAIRKELMRKYPKHSWPEDPTKPAPRFRPKPG